ncbi:MAG: hypothetical protein H6881_08295 [Rhodobiaceae bacterium]|nr:hypothetical protein [Rhodobiaceae bacterium]
MTAINILVMPDAVHVFSDGGHTANQTGRLAYLGAKVFYLPNINGLLAWTGGSERGRTIAALFDAEHDVIRDGVKLDRQPYSAIVARDGGADVMAYQDDAETIRLRAGNVVCSMKTNLTFDPADIIGSGLAMIHDQRERHGLVHGFIQYSRLDAGGFHSRVLERL